MTLIDPSGGLGLAFGAVLPSSQVTTVWTQQPNAVDGVGGGTYAGNLVWTGNHTFSGNLAGTPTGGALDLSATTLTLGAPDLAGVLNMSAAGSGIAYRTATLTGGNTHENISKAIDEYRILAAPNACVYTLLDASSIPADGQRIRVIITISNAIGDAIFKRETGATEIGRIVGNGNAGSIDFTYHSAANGWYVSATSGDGAITLHA